RTGVMAPRPDSLRPARRRDHSGGDPFLSACRHGRVELPLSRWTAAKPAVRSTSTAGTPSTASTPAIGSATYCSMKHRTIAEAADALELARQTLYPQISRIDNSATSSALD